MDPRTKKGQLLWPERMNERAIKLVTVRMRPDVVATQMEQLPGEAGGSIFNEAWGRLWTKRRRPPRNYIAISHRPADKKTDQGSYWATTVWGIFDWIEENPEDEVHGHPFKERKAIPNLMLLDAWHLRDATPIIKRRLIDTWLHWTYDTDQPDCLIIEDK